MFYFYLALQDTEESSKDVWDDVDTDFGGDETGNFGPRKESGTALYQVDTLATISPRGEVSSKVKNVSIKWSLSINQ